MDLSVAVVIPVRNEERDIADCIRCIGNQTVAPETMEVLLVDGRSQDATLAIANHEASTFNFGRFAIIDNPLAGTSAGLNAGLAATTAPTFARVDARSRIAPDYLERATAILHGDPAIGVVGGSQTTLARSASWRDRGLARAMRNRLSTGLSQYRLSRRSGPSDTVWLGCFRTLELRAIGGWDERLAVNEDFDLNERYRRSGQTVWFDVHLGAGYVPRGGLARIARQYARYGWWKGTLWARGQEVTGRHAAVMAVPVVAATAIVGMARLAGWRRVVVSSLLVLAAVDHLGADAPGSAPERAMASTTICVYCGAWWSGAVTGWLHEMLGRR